MKHEAHVEAYKRELAKQILDKAMDVSNDDYSVFVNYSPQIKGVHVSIHKLGWEANYEADYNRTVYLDWDNSVENLKGMLKDIDSHMEAA